ncbi:MAG: hypothetical protein ACE5PV_22995 [Candidatus Poribacteria bacterium]
MAEQGTFSIGDEVFIITGADDEHTGVFIGSNENTVNEKLLYTVKIENRLWVGPANRVFSKGTTTEEAMELLREYEEKQSGELLAQQAQREEEERRLAEVEEAVEEAESTET